MNYLLTAARYHEIVELFAKKAPDVRAEMSFGVYDGHEIIKRLYGRFHAKEIVVVGGRSGAFWGGSDGV